MKVLFIGDIFGDLGIEAIKQYLPIVKKEYEIDLVIANAENTTNCRGLSVPDYQKLISLGIDYITLGNHTWKQNDWKQMLEENSVIRPLNIDDEQKNRIGKGLIEFSFNDKKIVIVNLLGTSIKMNHTNITNPFNEMHKILNDLSYDILIVDFHAETTSEKNCFLHVFKDKATIIVGTHTHVQTNDAKIVENTAYITDIGMTGPSDGIIGADPQSIIDMFEEKNAFFRLTEAKGRKQFCAVLIEIDNENNLPNYIRNIYIQD